MAFLSKNVVPCGSRTGCVPVNRLYWVARACAAVHWLFHAGLSATNQTQSTLKRNIIHNHGQLSRIVWFYNGTTV